MNVRALQAQGPRLFALVASALVVAGLGGTSARAGQPVSPTDVTPPHLPSPPPVPSVPTLPSTPPVPDLGSAVKGATPGAGSGGGAVTGAVGGSAVRSGAGDTGSVAGQSGSGQGNDVSSPKAERIRQVRHKRQERRFRSGVRELQGCLAALPDGAERVLVLRVGLDGRRPHSRAHVARRLHMSRGGVARLERSGFRTLRRAARSDGCGPGGSATSAGDAGLAAGLGPMVSALLGAAAATGEPGADEGGVLGTSASGGKALDEGGKSLGRELSELALGPPDAGGARRGAGIALIILLLVGGVVLAREIRKQFRPAAY